MIETLRPSTLGEILDRTADIYRARFLVFLGIAGLPAGVVLASAVAVFLFFVWIGVESQGKDQTLVGVLVILFFAACVLVLLPLCAAAAGLGAGALNQAAVAACERRKIGIREAYQAAWKHGWRYIGVFLLEALMIFIAPSVVFLIALFVFGISAGLMGAVSGPASDTMGVIFLLLILAYAGYMLWMLLMLCLSFPASVAEGVGAWTAVKRAMALSRGTRGRILVLYILGFVLRWGLGFLLTVPAILIIALVPGLDTPQHARLIGIILLFSVYGGSFAVRAFTKPMYAIAQLLFYYDQRIRREGFDIEWMMRQAGMLAAPAVSEAAPWMLPVPRAPAVSVEAAEASVEPAAPVLPRSPGPNIDGVDPAPPNGEPA